MLGGIASFTVVDAAKVSVLALAQLSWRLACVLAAYTQVKCALLAWVAQPT